MSGSSKRAGNAAEAWIVRQIEREISDGLVLNLWPGAPADLVLLTPRCAPRLTSIAPWHVGFVEVKSSKIESRARNAKLSDLERTFAGLAARRGLPYSIRRLLRRGDRFVPVSPLSVSPTPFWDRWMPGDDPR